MKAIKLITLLILLVIITSLTTACSLKDEKNTAQINNNQNIQEEIAKISNLKIALVLYRFNELSSFNEKLNENDLVLIHDFLPQYFFQKTTAKKALVAQTFTDFNSNLERIGKAGFSYLIYDASTESQQNPDNKNRNILTDLAYLQQYATPLSYKIGIITDKNTLDENGKNLVPLVDLIIIQSEVWQAQGDPIFKNYISSLSEQSKKDKPGLEIFTQISTEPKGANSTSKKVTSKEMIKTIAGVSDKIEGMIIASSPDTINTFKEFIQKIRVKKNQ